MAPGGTTQLAMRFSILLVALASLATARLRNVELGKAATLLAGNATAGGEVPSSGSCADADYIHCVKVASLPSDFCTTTGQSNWCSSKAGQSWCICDWAYKKYTSKKSLSIDCAGTSSRCRNAAWMKDC